MIGTWTEGARAIADEIPTTTDADRHWLEADNARTLVTTWGPEIPANRAACATIPTTRGGWYAARLLPSPMDHMV